jgi:hypothetical protein
MLSLRLLMGNRSGLSACSRSGWSIESRTSKGSRRTKGGRAGTDAGKSGYKLDGVVNKKPLDKA